MALLRSLCRIGVRYFITLAALACILSAFSARAEGHKLKVLTSFLPIYCFTANIAGELADVQNLLPPGAEPHDFQFTPREMTELEAADLVVINGLGIEAWLGPTLASQEKTKPVVEAAAGLQEELITNASYLDPDNPDAAPSPSAPPNPHIWLDPQLAEHAVTNILLALQKADPANASAYAANARDYLARLDRLDKDIHAGLAPFKGQAIITFHDAFPYFARRYDLKIVGVVERVPDVQPSLKYLSALRGVIERDRVKVVFSEKQSPDRLVQQISTDYHIPVAQLDTLETGVFKPDAYEQGMRTNLATLEKNLK
jgi:zinc/manganese transport system substrate-binding protein